MTESLREYVKQDTDEGFMVVRPCILCNQNKWRHFPDKQYKIYAICCNKDCLNVIVDWRNTT